MTTPVALPQFTVTQYVEQAMQPEAEDAGAPVDIEALPIMVTFTPSVAEIQVVGNAPPFTVYVNAIQGRVDTDGYLKGLNDEPVFYVDATTTPPTIHPCPAGLTPVYIDQYTPAYWVDALGTHTPNPTGTATFGVRLVSNSPMLSLAQPLTYRVDYTRGPVALRSFRFEAPTTDVIVDLSVVERMTL